MDLDVTELPGGDAVREEDLHLGVGKSARLWETEEGPDCDAEVTAEPEVRCLGAPVPTGVSGAPVHLEHKGCRVS